MHAGDRKDLNMTNREYSLEIQTLRLYFTGSIYSISHPAVCLSSWRYTVTSGTLSSNHQIIKVLSTITLKTAVNRVNTIFYLEYIVIHTHILWHISHQISLESILPSSICTNVILFNLSCRGRKPLKPLTEVLLLL